MIYRKWSMLTGTIGITAGVAIGVLAADFLFLKSGPFAKTDSRKGHTTSNQ